MTPNRPIEVSARQQDGEVVISADKPIPADVVSDSRDNRWKRIALVVFALVVIYILVNQQLIGASNNDLLKSASQQRVSLLKSQVQLLDKLNKAEVSNGRQAQTIDDLYQIVLKEYQLLKKAGFTDKQIQTAIGGPVPSPKPSHSPQPKPQPSPRPSSSPSSRPSPSHSPSPHPTPSPTPSCLIHDPITGRCIANGAVTQVIRRERLIPRYEF